MPGAGYKANAAITHVCDVDSTFVAKFAAKTQQAMGTAPATEKDFRNLLARREIDAVTIATPDHWHAPMAIAALQAGVQTVMVSYNGWQGPKLHGHHYLITEVLKNRMGFDGLVVSDWNGIDEVQSCTVDACAQAVNLGLMVADPHDLEHGQGSIWTDTERDAQALSDYRSNKPPAPALALPVTPAQGLTPPASAPSSQ